MAAPGQNLGTELTAALTGLSETFIEPYVTQLVGGAAPIVVSAITIYLFFRGWAIIRGDTHETLPALTRDVFRIAFILAIGLSAGVYVADVVGTLFALRTWLVEVMLNGATLAGLMDQLWGAARTFINQQVSSGLFGFLQFNAALGAAILTILAVGLLLVFAIGIYGLCHIALTLLAAVGPIFILCAMFPSTQRFAESWLSQMLNYVMLTALSSAATAMALTFGIVHLTKVMEERETINLLTSVVAFDIAILAICVLLLNLNNMATALTGGIGLQGASRMIAAVAMRAVSPAAVGGRAAAGGAIGAGGNSGFRGSVAEGTGNARTPAYLYQQAARLGQQRS